MGDAGDAGVAGDADVAGDAGVSGVGSGIIASVDDGVWSDSAGFVSFLAEAISCFFEGEVVAVFVSPGFGDPFFLRVTSVQPS